jgi:ribosomal 50S subunit-recycling heat shock protein
VRLDKFLQASRLVKRRTLANRLCNAGRVEVNGQRAKPAVEVIPGAVVSLHLGTRHVVVKVLRIPTGKLSSEPVVETLEDRRLPDTW